MGLFSNMLNGIAGVGTVIGFNAYLATAAVPNSPPVPAGKTRICVAGGNVSGNSGRAHAIAHAIAVHDRAQYESWYYWTGLNQYYTFIEHRFGSVPFPANLKGHSTAPFVWLERTATEADKASGVHIEKDGRAIIPIGGRDDFAEWARAHFADSREIVALLQPLGPLTTRINETIRHGSVLPHATARHL